MRVLNQLDYENILYPTSLVKGEQPAEPYPSVAKAGCGLICACMLVCILTDKQAGNSIGTNNKKLDNYIFAPYILNRHQLHGEQFKC